MTSRSLCFKLMKEDLKRRVWTIALTILPLVFTLLVPVAIKTGEYLDELTVGMSANARQRWARNLTQFLGVNGAVILVLVILAVVWAVSGFRYLHNSRQVDFYHSIPVRRGQLFLASYINGLLVTAAVYFVIQAASAALVLRTGVREPFISGIWWKIYLLNMVYYAMLYTTAVIAMMMTGNIIVALLGTCVFCGYGPSVVTLIVGYRQTWFHTLYETERQQMFWVRALRYSSPFADYMLALESFSEDGLSVPGLTGALAATGLLACLAYVLYRLRPSESAGKAMAFKRTQSPIKLLIALPVGVLFGIMFYSVRSTMSWGIFGALCGSVITCCLMEIIYHFDFRKLFANWIQLAACAAASVLLIIGGIYDWFGYDSHLPGAASVKSASVCIGADEGWVTYGEPVMTTDFRGDVSYVWDYESQREYQFEHMELTDIYTVMELAKKGIQSNKEIRAMGNQAWGNVRYNDSQWKRYVVCFQLTGGRETARQYLIPVDEEVRLLEAAVHDSREYKKGTYPILGQSAADTVSVYFQQYDQVQKLEVDGEEKAKLLAVYQKDLEEQLMADREKELPIGTIQFRTTVHQEAVDFYQKNDAATNHNLEDRCYYPVYPSFVRTIEAVREAGGTVQALDADMISEVRIEYYMVHEGDDMTMEEAAIARSIHDGRELIYDDKEDIDMLSSALVFWDYANMNEYYQADYADNVNTATVIFSVPRVGSYRISRSGRCYIDLNRLSGQDIKRFGFMREEEMITEEETITYD